MNAWAGAVALALLLYPLLAYAFFDELGLVGLAVAFAALTAARALSLPALSWPRRLAGAAAVTVFAAAVLVLDSTRLLKLYPVAANLALLGYALYTLSHPPSAIERLVRALGQPVSTAGVAYTRNVTILWCVFFTINGLAAAYTALAAPTAWWAWYNGAVSYGLAGVLFAGEYLFRGYYRRRIAQRPATDACPDS